MSWSRYALAAVALGLSGCTKEVDKTSALGWSKPNATLQVYQADFEDCRRSAVVVPVSASRASGVVSERSARFMDCMTGRGWTLREKKPDERSVGNDSVDCRLPGTEQPQRLSMKDCFNRYGKVL